MFHNCVILAIDIETTGPSVYRNDMFAIGYVYLNSFSDVLLKKRISLNYNNERFDGKCLNFWLREKNYKIFEQITKETVPIRYAMEIFYNDFMAFKKNYNVIIVSDNPTFDIGFINYYLDKYIGKPPININPHFSPIHDLKSFLRGKCSHIKISSKNITIQKYCDLLYISTVDINHDHNPENDAEYIAKVYFRAINLD